MVRRTEMSSARVLNRRASAREPSWRALAGIIALGLALFLVNGSGAPRAARGAPAAGVIAVSLATGNGSDGSAGIAIIDTSGRRLMSLTRPAKDGEDSEPAWSPDGKRLAFRRTTDGRYSFQIYVMNANGSGMRRIGVAARLIYDYSPAWSPDGRWIAYRSNGELRVVHPDSTGDRLIATGHPTEVTNPAWAPGGRISYSYYDTVPQDWPALCTRARSGCGYVVTARLDGSDRRLVLRGRDAHWSPDQRTIVFTGSDGGVYTVSATGGRPRFLGKGHLASWSPDGTKIVYVRQGDRASTDSVWIMARDGGNPHRILVGASTPAWQP